MAGAAPPRQCSAAAGCSECGSQPAKAIDLPSGRTYMPSLPVALDGKSVCQMHKACLPTHCCPNLGQFAVNERAATPPQHTKSTIGDTAARHTILESWFSSVKASPSIISSTGGFLTYILRSLLILRAALGSHVVRPLPLVQRLQAGGRGRTPLVCALVATAPSV